MAFTFQHGDRPLDGFTIQRGVGRGGFGDVYYAISDAGKEVALKHLRENLPVELRGVSHCMNLKSPYLVTVFDIKSNEDGETFVVMEYVHGPSLRDLMIAEPQGLGPQKAAYFTREIAKGLGSLHDCGIVHRDLKPGNIFYEDGYVKIGDYGLSKFISVSKHSGQTASVGTVHYMAPEVGSGNYHRGIDIYSLGVMLYEMLCGRVPFEGSSLGEVLMKHLMEQPDLEGLPFPFADVIRKALAKDPKDRYQRVEEMIAGLFEVQDVADSVAGFEPTSLSAAVKRIEVPTPPTQAVGEQPAKAGPGSPESGTPPPPQAPEVSPEVAPEAWENYADAMEQWGKQFGDRMDVWGKRFGHRMDAWGKHVGKRWTGAGQKFARKATKHAEKAAKKARKAAGKAGKNFGAHAAEADHASRPTLYSFKNKSQRILVATIVSAALAVGVAILGDALDVAPLAFFGIAGLTAALIVAERLGGGIVAAGDNNILRRLLTVGCAAPVIWFGLVVFDAPRGTDVNALGLALMISMVLIDWSRRLQEGVNGRIDAGDAFKAALCGGIVTLLFADYVALPIAGLMASVSLIAQTVGPVFMKPILEPLSSPGHPVWGPEAPPLPPKARVRGLGRHAADAGRHAATAAHYAQQVGQMIPRKRLGFLRFMWMFLAACLVSVGAVCFISLGTLRGLEAYAEALLICYGTGLCVFALFPLWHAIRYHSHGFWFGLVRRFIVTAGLTVSAVGGCIIGLADELGLRHALGHNNEAMVVAICITAAGGVFALLFLLLGLRPRRLLRNVSRLHAAGEVS